MKDEPNVEGDPDSVGSRTTRSFRLGKETKELREKGLEVILEFERRTRTILGIGLGRVPSEAKIEMSPHVWMDFVKKEAFDQNILLGQEGFTLHGVPTEINKTLPARGIRFIFSIESAI